MTLVHPPVPTDAHMALRFGVFFDGTGNNQANALDRPADLVPTAFTQGSYANTRSNIALLHGLYPSGLDGSGATCHVPLYIAGIGTSDGLADSMIGQATGRGATGIEARVEQALQQIARHLQQWLTDDSRQSPVRIEFDLFGFSRGAAAARHLANRLHDAAARLPGWPADLHCTLTIHFIGLFDTVAAVLDPLSDGFDSAGAKLGSLRLGLDAAIARSTVQLVALDEHRHNFALVASLHDVGLPGAHSDIGGGYPLCMQEQVMLSKPFSSQMPLRGLAQQSSAYHAAAQALQTLVQEGEAAMIRTWEIPDESYKARREEPQKRVYACVYREREVLGHLSRIYLSIMRELAVRDGVPFAPLGRDVALPDELQAISAHLHDYALGRTSQLGVSAAQRSLLQERYIHASAHWNASGEPRDSALEMIFFNRPATGGQRRIHANPPR